jgi:hypothetical protein
MAVKGQAWMARLYQRVSRRPPRPPSGRALREDALAVPGVALAVVLEQLVAVGAVVPAAVVKGLGLGARRAALRLPQLGRDDHAAVRAQEHVRYRVLPPEIETRRRSTTRPKLPVDRSALGEANSAVAVSVGQRAALMASQDTVLSVQAGSN